MRTAILISGRGSNMQTLVKAAQAADYPAEIALVLANRPDAAGLIFAKQHGINAIALDHHKYSERAAFDAAMAENLHQNNIELVVLAGFMRLLSPEFVKNFAGRIINIHPSLLPSYRGLNTHQRVLDDGGKLHGCSVHYVVPELDAGPIIAQAAVPVFSADTVDDLAARVLKAEHQLYPRALQLVAAGAAPINNGKVELTSSYMNDEAALLLSLN